MPKPLVLAVMTFLHDLFTAVWVGGLIAQGLVILPSVRDTLAPGPQRKKLLAAIGRRQGLLVYVSIVGLIVTGLLEARASGSFLGLLSTGNAYSAVLAVKHVLVLAMIGLALYRSLALARQGGVPGRERLSAGLLLASMALGVAVLLLSGIGATLPAAPQLPG
ncbi:MAG TPA: hypothetical protein PLJ35_15380 [Anaerolineae bacterium]|nr:hypothetical protein [Anaerolineae bacterium]HOR00195.1 hypothetical protein [Anaerolineae bacterium]